MLKTQQRFKIERNNVFTEEINEIVLIRLISNDDKRMQSIDLIETYAQETSKDLVCKKAEIKCNNIIKLQKKMFNFDYNTKADIKEHYPNYPESPDHSYRILIVGDSGYGKENGLLNLINNNPYINKIYLYAKDPYRAKYQLLTNKRESTGLKYLIDSKAVIE